MPKMKAAIFVEPGRIVLDEKPIPDVGPLDALIRMTTTTICGTDIHILKGAYPVRKGLTVGHEPVGVIEKLGSAVQGSVFVPPQSANQRFPMPPAERMPYRQNGTRSTRVNIISPPSTANRRRFCTRKGATRPAKALKTRGFLCQPRNQWNCRDWLAEGTRPGSNLLCFERECRFRLRKMLLVWLAPTPVVRGLSPKRSFAL
jgi:hypothetical protein